MLRLLQFLGLMVSASCMLAQQAITTINSVHTPLLNAYFAKEKINQHTGFAPYLLDDLTMDSIFDAETNTWKRKDRSNWVLKKLKREHLFEVKTNDFMLKGDATFNFEVSTERDDQSRRYFTNIRGYNFYGAIGNRIIFNTSFNECQSIFPNYMDSVVFARGSVVNFPDPERGSVPGFGRWKPFNTSSSYDYDYAFATGTATFVVSEHTFLQFGSDKQFVGYGHRSLFLSDASAAYPFLRWQLSFWKNRISYTTTWAVLQSLDRIAPINYNSKEAMFARLGARFSYLHFQPWHWIGVGLFDGTTWTWRHNSEPMSIEYYMPHGFLYTGTGIRNHVVGLNGFVSPTKYFTGYAQFGVNTIASGRAVQLGVRAHNLVGFSAVVEFNKISQGFYHNGFSSTFGGSEAVITEPFGAATRAVDYYQNNDQFLAHPMGVQLTEFLVKANYRYRDFTASASYYRIVKTPIVNANNLVELMQFEVGYIINPKSNAMIVGGLINRNETWANQLMTANYPYISFRTTLFNRYLDF